MARQSSSVSQLEQNPLRTQYDWLILRIAAALGLEPQLAEIASRLRDRPRGLITELVRVFIQALVRRVPVAPSIVDYAVRLARATRPDDAGAPPFVREMVAWGAGPRASQYLVLGSKARAALDGRPAPNLDDVRALAPDVLRHRIVTGFEAEAAGRTPDDLIDELISTVRA